MSFLLFCNFIKHLDDHGVASNRGGLRRGVGRGGLWSHCMEIVAGSANERENSSDEDYALREAGITRRLLANILEHTTVDVLSSFPFLSSVFSLL
jgi:hypothetical protein